MAASVRPSVTPRAAPRAPDPVPAAVPAAVPGPAGAIRRRQKPEQSRAAPPRRNRHRRRTSRASEASGQASFGPFRFRSPTVAPGPVVACRDGCAGALLAGGACPAAKPHCIDHDQWVRASRETRTPPGRSVRPSEAFSAPTVLSIKKRLCGVLLSPYASGAHIKGATRPPQRGRPMPKPPPPRPLASDRNRSLTVHLSQRRRELVIPRTSLGMRGRAIGPAAPFPRSLDQHRDPASLLAEQGAASRAGSSANEARRPEACRASTPAGRTAPRAPPRVPTKARATRRRAHRSPSRSTASLN